MKLLATINNHILSDWQTELVLRGWTVMVAFAMLMTISRLIISNSIGG